MSRDLRILTWTTVILAIAVVVSAQVETVVRFNPEAFETPRSIQFDRRGNAYIAMGLTGEIRRIALDGNQNTLAFLPLRPDVVPCQNAFGFAILWGITLDYQGNIYASVNSCNPSDLGIWKVSPDGGTVLLGGLFIGKDPPTASPSGITYHDGWLYIADAVLGLVWRLHSDGHSPAEIWTSDPLLSHPPDPPPMTPGPNGLQVFRNEVYVSVSDRRHIVAFPIEEDGRVGTGRVHAGDVRLDDFAFDVRGNLYGATGPFNTVLSIAPDGAVTTLLTIDDGLDGPTATAFGVGLDNKTLYITNASFPFFDSRRMPSLMALKIGIPGKPRP
jgi:hypothetical protein